MGSLFLRIFLWYWIAMALLGLALVAVTATTRPENESERWQARNAEMLQLQARAATALYATGGRAAAQAYLSGPGRERAPRLWLFDETGQLLAGSRAPLEARQLAAQTLRAADGRARRETFFAQAVRAPDGQRYTLVSRRNPPRAISTTRFRLFGRRVQPWEQALRLAVVLLIAGVLCYVLARYLTVPVVRLRAATQQLAAGNLKARVGPSLDYRRDELAGLARDFDVMAARLENLVLSQRRLIGDMSHELRSPLARLNVALELARLHDAKGAREALQIDLDRAERESTRLNALIGQLLSLAHLEMDETRAALDEVDGEALLEEIVADADFEAHHRQRAVRIEESAPCSIIGDRELLRRAIENVVRNAIFYTAQGTAVEIALRCSPESGEAVIRVRDHGPGVPESELSELFRPFHRVETARDRQSGGAGLGLAIAERAVRLHHGSIEARNAPGGGLMVELRLPLQSDRCKQKH